MTAVDFMTGILAGLALRGERVLDLNDTRVDEAFAAVYQEALDRADEKDLDVDFQIIPDSIHGDSTVVQDAIREAVAARLVNRINPSFRRIRITIDPAWAEALTADLPGGGELYRNLAARFLLHYRGTSVPA
jgi:hypothetical protein